MDRHKIITTLQEVWGYSDFRPPQFEVITSLLAKQDTLVVMPTGGGKSLCFQLPALLQSGLTIVVSPLIALMENQVQQLDQLRNRELKACLIHSQQSKSDRRSILGNLNQFKLLYVAPETLLSPPVWQRLIQPDLEINYLVVDEAHCLVQWGATFRPSYTRLGAIRDSLLANKPKKSKLTLAAFTATADPQTQRKITKTLRLKQPKRYIFSPYRSNLNLQVKTVWTPRQRKTTICHFAEKQQQHTGIIYVQSRRASEELAAYLRSQKIQALAYHAGLLSSRKRVIELDWLTGKLPIVICTSAFGMGIDKKNCRWVLHYQVPSLIAEYIQEVGRSGRDGNLAHGLALASEPSGLLDPSDKQRIQFRQKQLGQQNLKAQKIFAQLPDQGNILEMKKQIPELDLTLGVLQNQDLIRWQDPWNFKKTSNLTKKPQLPHPSTSTQMSKFLRTRTCRWQFILSAFGFQQKADQFSCGHCDRCLGKK